MRSIDRIARNARVLAACALAVLAGCATTASHEEFFTLTSPADGAAAPSAYSPAVFVGPVSIPEGVDRPQMVLTTGPNRVDIADEYHWAEPLRDAIARAVAQGLSRELGTGRVLVSSAASGSRVDYRVAIELQRFDSSFSDGAAIDALWTVSSADGKRTRNGRSAQREPDASHDAAGIAAAHARALERMAGDIAQAIRALQSEAAGTR